MYKSSNCLLKSVPVAIIYLLIILPASYTCLLFVKSQGREPVPARSVSDSSILDFGCRAKIPNKINNATNKQTSGAIWHYSGPMMLLYPGAMVKCGSTAAIL